MNIVYDALLTHIPGIKVRGGPNVWSTFNAVCCEHNGESRPDHRQRGGLIIQSNECCVYHCFNCKYSASWTPGFQINKKMENLLEWANVPDYDIKKLKFKAWQIWMNARSENPNSIESYQVIPKLTFEERKLPEGSRSFTELLEQEKLDEEFIDVLTYVDSRNKKLIEDYNFFWSKTNEHNLNKRVIVPFYWDDKIVGYTARDASGTLKDRYFSETQPDYIFNTGSIDYDNEFIFVCEGPFDAMAIDGVALLGDKMTKKQAEWLNNTEKKIIIVGDLEKEGGKLVDSAIENGWYVSFPNWGLDYTVKDAAEAVFKYGKFYTMMSILQNYTNSKMKIKTWRQMRMKNRKHFD